MFRQKKEEVVTEFLTPKVDPVVPVVDEVDRSVYPMPQEKQPDPVYGFAPPRDEAQYTGQGYVHPENED